MSPHRLKSVLATGPDGWPAARLPRFELEPRRLEVASAKIARQLDEYAPSVITGRDLDKLLREARSQWAEERSLEQFPRRTLKRLVWALFHPSDAPGEWLVHDTEFMVAYARWIMTCRSTAPLRGLIHQYLQVYPHDESLRSWLQRTIRETLARNQSIQVAPWVQRQQNYKIFDDEGPKTVAQRWLAGTDSREAFERDTGLYNIVSAGRFAFTISSALLHQLHERLRVRSISAAALKRALEWLVEGRTLRFVQLRDDLVKALLLPFETQRPEPEIETMIQTFLLDLLGDPRTARSSWGVIEPRLVAIIRRWLVGATLEDFFRVLDKTAIERQWLYRKSFWTAYLKLDVIADAWVVLGPDAKIHAGDLTRKGLAAAGSLYGGYDTFQSVLLMKLGNLVIAEWSHNGMCRFWAERDPLAPRLYDSQYTADRLRRASAEAVTHVAAESGSWQRKVAAYIQRETGIRVSSTDYMPRSVYRR